jgi:pimeloyl-ACP methyl ester carboxylesterase
MMPGAEVVTVPGSHAAMLENPAEYAAVITAFFQRAHAGTR